METLTHFQEDVLGDILQSIHLHSTLFCRAKMGAPLGFRCYFGIAPGAYRQGRRTV